MPQSREFRTHGNYEGVHRQRQIEVAVQLFEAMDIERNDKEKRHDWVMRGFRQFDAPGLHRDDLRQGLAKQRHRTF